MTWKPCTENEHTLDQNCRCIKCGIYNFFPVENGPVIIKEKELEPVTRSLVDDPEVPLGYAQITERGDL